MQALQNSGCMKLGGTAPGSRAFDLSGTELDVTNVRLESVIVRVSPGYYCYHLLDGEGAREQKKAAPQCLQWSRN